MKVTQTSAMLPPKPKICGWRLEHPQPGTGTRTLPAFTKRGVAFKGQGLPEPEQPEEPELGAAGAAAIAGGLVSNPIVLWSAFTLYKTGEGLPPGPNGALGAAEGVSYLAVLGLVAWSLYTKVSTGKGLPPGPSGLLGAVEGLSYLSILAAIAAFALKP
ncbi:hypothetical protein V8C86DRAFT_2484220 [Haematococcus lacustris]